jgi:hypothetical protein
MPGSVNRHVRRDPRLINSSHTDIITRITATKLGSSGRKNKMLRHLEVVGKGQRFV